MAYRFIDKYKEFFGLRWLLRRLDIYPNAYYNYRKNRRASYHRKKAGDLPSDQEHLLSQQPDSRTQTYEDLSGKKRGCFKQNNSS